MDPRRALSRRRFLAGVATAAVPTGAGCTGGDAPDERADTGRSDDPEGETGAAREGSGLDLAEANVVGVSVEAGNDGYRFDVTLHHDDDGEEGYANRWVVERPDGTELGRRELLHPHSRQPFTRSETIDVPDGVSCVVVRGHDQTHGYGGRAFVVTPDTGATRAIQQGSNRQSVAESECP